ncbi:unnamed protein product [Strongylus vulgaris]|uniref:Uncharacterized protein n=1 Tax=Strongylus vulgaris TaxID=40348 RepID=A0A3P7J3B1_STRVU|nr:unnamed protein product [Strongylus vulgaris]
MLLEHGTYQAFINLLFHIYWTTRTNYFHDRCVRYANVTSNTELMRFVPVLHLLHEVIHPIVVVRNDQ